MVWCCMYFAFLLKKNMSNTLCNFVFASKDEPCNPHTQNVFLTHGTMLPVWSSDRAHAGRCLARAGCRFTSSRTAMGLKKSCPGHMEKARVCICWWFFRLPIFPKVQPGVMFFFDIGEQSPSQLKMFFMRWRPRLWHRAVFSIWTVGVGPRLVFTGLLGRKNHTFCIVIW